MQQRTAREARRAAIGGGIVGVMATVFAFNNSTRQWVTMAILVALALAAAVGIVQYGSRPPRQR